MDGLHQYDYKLSRYNRQQHYSEFSKCGHYQYKCELSWFGLSVWLCVTCQVRIFTVNCQGDLIDVNMHYKVWSSSIWMWVVGILSYQCEYKLPRCWLDWCDCEPSRCNYHKWDWYFSKCSPFKCFCEQKKVLLVSLFGFELSRCGLHQ